ncbi:MAG: hypothetical protein R2764_00460 [Bacteroidales bacterium]
MARNQIVIFLFTAVYILCSNLSCSNRNDIPESGIKAHFPSSDEDYYEADSMAGHFHKKDASREFKWPEHPSGKIVMKTNNLGFRNDENTQLVKAPGVKRVLITGDSHTDGVLYNSESVAAKLESYLSEENPNQAFEVLNGGNGYFGPQNYLGVLNKFLPLKPDVYIVIIYTGNDYLDGIRIESENGRLETPERPNDYFDKLWEVDGLYSGFTGQYLNQVKFFKTYPEYADTALKIMTENLSAIKNTCSNNNIRLMVMLLPTKLDTEPETDRQRIDEVFRIMDFTNEDIQNNQLLSTHLTLWMDKNQIPFLDLYDPFMDSKDELFWLADYHVNHLGHAKIAEQILKSQLLDFSK